MRPVSEVIETSHHVARPCTCRVGCAYWNVHYKRIDRYGLTCENIRFRGYPSYGSAAASASCEDQIVLNMQPFERTMRWLKEAV